MPLTDLEIRYFQPASRAYKKADGLGLFVEVMPTGSKLWRWKYRIPICGCNAARAVRSDRAYQGLNGLNITDLAPLAALLRSEFEIEATLGEGFADWMR